MTVKAKQIPAQVILVAAVFRHGEETVNCCYAKHLKAGVILIGLEYFILLEFFQRGKGGAEIISKGL